MELLKGVCTRENSQPAPCSFVLGTFTAGFGSLPLVSRGSDVEVRVPRTSTAFGLSRARVRVCPLCTTTTGELWDTPGPCRTKRGAAEMQPHTLCDEFPRDAVNYGGKEA